MSDERERDAVAMEAWKALTDEARTPENLERITARLRFAPPAGASDALSIRQRELAPPAGETQADPIDRWRKAHGLPPRDRGETQEPVARHFPIQDTVGMTVPWAEAEIAYANYARLFGDDQSMDRLAERGGFSIWEYAALRFGLNPARLTPPSQRETQQARIVPLQQSEQP